jgi:hypothetical protein
MPQSRQKKRVSPKQLRANRRNAQRSTGPRTDEGKSRAAKNAIVHGILCRDLLMPGEDPKEFEAFRDLLLDGLQPQDFLERLMAEQYVEAKWRARRVRGAERDAHELLAAEIEVFDGNVFATVRDRLRDLPRLESLRPGDDDPRPKSDPLTLEQLREQRYAERRAVVPVSATMALSFHRNDTPSFERLSRYQQRLELMADRALRQLRQLRKERGPDWVAPDEQEGIDEHDVIIDSETTPTPRGVVGSATTCINDELPVKAHAAPAQNEPISAAPLASRDGAESCADDVDATRGAMAPELFRPVRLTNRVTESDPAGVHGEGVN